MPNLTNPILTAEDALAYYGRIVRVDPKFQPLMTIKLVPSTTPKIIRDAKKAGVIAAKFYPEGVTTNSQDGAKRLKELYKQIEVMQEEGMVLCLHGEMPGVFTMDREKAFLKDLLQATRDFPKLKIVLEHITTEDAVGYVSNMLETVAATITVHHLMITLDDVIGDKLQPHNFCKPVAKTPADLRALRYAATEGNSKFFLGTDSAPHLMPWKECASGCAGVFSAPCALSLLATVFEEMNALHRLNEFTSENGAKFYGLPLNSGNIEIIKKENEIPTNTGNIVPFMAGKKVNWEVQIANDPK